MKYASQLTNQEILAFLYSTPFRPVHLTEYDGSPIPVIRKHNDCISVTVRITNDSVEKFIKTSKPTKKYANIPSKYLTYSKTGTIEIRDYTIICPFDKSISVDADWHAFMNTRFPNEYNKDLQDYEKTLDIFA